MCVSVSVSLCVCVYVCVCVCVCVCENTDHLTDQKKKFKIGTGSLVQHSETRLRRVQILPFFSIPKSLV